MLPSAVDAGEPKSRDIARRASWEGMSDGKNGADRWATVDSSCGTATFNPAARTTQNAMTHHRRRAISSPIRANRALRPCAMRPLPINHRVFIMV
ncbi:hypothetical protein GCM10009773_29710 [Williamsia serinedens]